MKQYNEFIKKTRDSMVSNLPLDYNTGDAIVTENGQTLLYLGDYFQWFNIMVREEFGKVVVFNNYEDKLYSLYLPIGLEGVEDNGSFLCKRSKVPKVKLIRRGLWSEKKIKEYLSRIKDENDVWKMGLWSVKKEEYFEDGDCEQFAREILGVVKNILENKNIKSYLLGEWDPSVCVWRYVK